MATSYYLITPLDSPEAQRGVVRLTLSKKNLSLTMIAGSENFPDLVYEAGTELKIGEHYSFTRLTRAEAMKLRADYLKQERGTR